jgi:hypothetical protein
MALDMVTTPLKVTIAAKEIVRPVIFSTVFTVQDRPRARVKLNIGVEMPLPQSGMETKSRGKPTTVALVWLAEMCSSIVTSLLPAPELARELVFTLVADLLGASVAADQEDDDFAFEWADLKWVDRWCCRCDGSPGHTGEMDAGWDARHGAPHRDGGDCGRREEEQNNHPSKHFDDQRDRMRTKRPTVANRRAEAKTVARYFVNP